MQDWIVTFSIPEAPNDFASVIAHRKTNRQEVEEWVKRMFGSDISIFAVIPRYPETVDTEQDWE